MLLLCSPSCKAIGLDVLLDIHAIAASDRRYIFKEARCTMSLPSATIE